MHVIVVTANGLAQPFGNQHWIIEKDAPGLRVPFDGFEHGPRRELVIRQVAPGDAARLPIQFGQFQVAA